jgi:hypothetical protein
MSSVIEFMLPWPEDDEIDGVIVSARRMTIGVWLWELGVSLGEVAVTAAEGPEVLCSARVTLPEDWSAGDHEAMLGQLEGFE